MIEPVSITPYQIAERFIGMEEVPGKGDNPQILAWLTLDNKWPEHDEVPWCSAFVQYPFWLLRLPRSKSLAARSWLSVGQPIALEQAEPGFDVVVLSRGSNPAAGHVGFYSGRRYAAGRERVSLLGGNQGDTVCVAEFDAERIVPGGIRRIR